MIYPCPTHGPERRDEQREVQFEIQEQAWMPEFARGKFPIVVWVLWPAEEVVDFHAHRYQRECKCKFVYRVTRKSIRTWKRRFPGYVSNSRECVCACWGRLIE